MKLIRLVLVALGILAAGVTLTPSAVAMEAQTPTSPTTSTLPGATPIDRNFAFTGATITSPADPTPRSLNGYQAAVFVQSWLPEALYGKPTLNDPPANLPVYRVDIMGSWGGEDPQVGIQTVYYASDGTNAYLSFPQGQAVSPTPIDPPPAPGVWFVAPQRTMDAFNGRGTLVDTAGTQEANTPRTASPRPTSTSSSSSTPWALYGVLIAAVAVIIVGAVVHFRRTPAD